MAIHPPHERRREEWLDFKSHFQVHHSVLVLQLMNHVIFISVHTWVKRQHKDAWRTEGITYSYLSSQFQQKEHYIYA